jgi:2-polyprenyl-3-methyl-5-hydroxy-6-metoxy-1,4-benzoquinol methylase
LKLIGLKICYRKIFPGHRYSLIPRLLEDCESILDLGCGRTSPLNFCNPKFSVGVDIFKPYIAESQKRKIHTTYLLSDITSVEFKAKSFDAVICTEVLEHLPKIEGYRLIERMKIWAKKKVIVSTPNGYCRQGAIDHNEKQIHRSG